MLNVNKVELIGNVASNPEVRTLGDGSKVANVRIATNETWKKDGERKERVEYHQLVIWKESLIDFVSEHVRKGAYVRVMAKLQHRKVEKAGEPTEYRTDIVVRQVDFLESKAVSSSRGAANDDDSE